MFRWLKNLFNELPPNPSVGKLKPQPGTVSIRVPGEPYGTSLDFVELKEEYDKLAKRYTDLHYRHSETTKTNIALNNRVKVLETANRALLDQASTNLQKVFLLQIENNNTMKEKKSLREARNTLITEAELFIEKIHEHMKEWDAACNPFKKLEGPDLALNCIANEMKLYKTMVDSFKSGKQK